MSATAWQVRDTGQRLPVPGLPAWLEPLATGLDGVHVRDLTRFVPPPEGGRDSAVLILLGHGAQGPDVLLIQRADDMRAHAGQPAFPGGARDSDDIDAAAAALREAEEETGLDPRGVEVFGLLPTLWVPVSGFVVAPVIGWWRDPSPVSAVDRAEVASVHRIPIAELAEPAHRMRVRHPSGYVGLGFEVHGLTVWGFTAGLLSGILDLGGWARPWGPDRVVTVGAEPDEGAP